LVFGRFFDVSEILIIDDSLQNKFKNWNLWFFDSEFFKELEPPITFKNIKLHDARLHNIYFCVPKIGVDMFSSSTSLMWYFSTYPLAPLVLWLFSKATHILQENIVFHTGSLGSWFLMTQMWGKLCRFIHFSIQDICDIFCSLTSSVNFKMWQ
jgi:hypothetical protein